MRGEREGWSRQKRLVLLFTAAGLALLYAALNPQAGEVSTIAILTPEQADDYGWNQQGVAAAKAAGKAAGVDVELATGLGYDDVRPTLRELAGEGADLMIAHASAYNTAAPEIAEETGIPVAIVDRPDALKPGLVADYTLSGHEGAYLAGRLAAMVSRSGTLGVVVSGEPPAWNSHSYAFAQGARDERKDVRLLYAVIGPAAYADAAGGRRVAAGVIAAGADVVFGQGDGSSFGMLQAVETTKALDGGKAFFIDVIGDKEPIDKGYLLSSVVWNIEPVYAAMIADLKAGTFGTRHYSIGLRDDSVRLLKTPQIPDGAWTRIEVLRRDVVSGRIKVEPHFGAAEVRSMMTRVSE